MPEWGNLSFNDVMTGLWFAVFGVLGWIGSRVGVRKPTAPPPSSVEVAGALIDTKRIDSLIAALDMNTVALTEKKLNLAKNTAALEAHSGALVEARRALDRNTDQAREVSEEAERLSRDMRELGDRMARSGRN